MKDIVREYQAQFRRHRMQLRRYTALLLALAMVTTLFVNWQLHSDGIAKTADPICGLEEHHHTVNCLSDPLDGLEDESHWLDKTGMWNENLLTVAPSTWAISAEICPLMP